jgi:Xaa-Pro aminopeptidase
MQSATTTSLDTSSVTSRLAALRAKMRERGVDAVIVRSTDRYLNEYVPTEESTRVWITGFSGSMGDAVVTGDRAVLFVDGRYTLQASQEAPAFEARTVTLGTSIEGGWLALLEELPAQGVRKVGVETDRVPASLFETLTQKAKNLGLELVATTPSLVEEVRRASGELVINRKAPIWPIDAKLVGRTVRERLELARGLFTSNGHEALDGLLVTALDEIAWITNLRGLHFDYQATFRAQALVRRDEVIVAADPRYLKKGTLPEDGVRLVGEDGLADEIKKLVADKAAPLRVGYDASMTPEATRAGLERLGCAVVKTASPFAHARTKKTGAELAHMVAAFERADAVVSKVKSWLCGAVARGEKITEAMVAEKTATLFKRSGAFGLSFKVISAAGKNGAVIHYSTPDESTPIRAGELFLLDTGAYYEGGLATDLTRTFLVGGPSQKATPEQQRMFTLVLQGAIAGMCARIPVGSTGEQLDALVRRPLWQAGLDYGHGTGHGVGVNVHESPPRVAIGARVALEPGQVFSIEPGVYLPDVGGVRIENLCTLVEDTETPPKGVPRKFLRVKPLTFSPLDLRLVDKSMLTAHEKAFLKWFHLKGDRGMPPPV